KASVQNHGRSPMGSGAGRQATQHEARNRSQRLEDAAAMKGVGSECRHSAEVERLVECLLAEYEITWKIALVVLQHHGERTHVDVLRRQVLVKVAKALHILLELARLAVRHEYHPVSTLEYQLARGGVVDLPRNRVKL